MKSLKSRLRLSANSWKIWPQSQDASHSKATNEVDGVDETIAGTTTIDEKVKTIKGVEAKDAVVETETSKSQ